MLLGSLINRIGVIVAAIGDAMTFNRITEAGDNRITEAGDMRITEGV